MSSRDYPYAERFGVNRTLPEKGRSREEVLAELRDHGERGGRLLGDRQVSRGRCTAATTSHYDVHERGVRPVRPRQHPPARHVPERHEDGGRGHRHGARPHARRRGHRRRARRAGHDAAAPAASCTPCSPTARRRRRNAASTSPTSSSPRPATPRSTRRATCSASSCAGARRPEYHPGRRRLGARTTSTTRPSAIIGSACNYGYGTIDPIEELSDLALERGVGLHVDGCLGGFILPFGQELGYDIPVFDFRLPGVTSISADTHKYGYAFKGTSVLPFRDKALRDGAVLLPHRLERRQVLLARAWRARAPAACSPRRGRRW